MDPSMSFHLEVFGEALVAEVANEVFHVGVLLLLRSQVVDQCEGLAAHEAFKWFFTGVGHLVLS